MQILLLSRGDVKSKDLLRQALKARYGFGVPALDGVKIAFKGRARIKLGPVATWIPMEATALYRFPAHARWDFSIRPVGVPMRSESRTFDDAVYCRQQGDNIEFLDTLTVLKAMREQVWASALMLLTPLTEQNVEVAAVSDRSMLATNLHTQASAMLHLNDDYTLSCVETRTFDIVRNRESVFTVQCSEGYQMVNDLMLPRKISLLWDHESDYEASPTAVELNPALEDGMFQLHQGS